LISCRTRGCITLGATLNLLRMTPSVISANAPKPLDGEQGEKQFPAEPIGVGFGQGGVAEHLNVRQLKCLCQISAHVLVVLVVLVIENSENRGRERGGTNTPAINFVDK
jgi:hypothetical protein